ncbi:MAG TPA: hypothetical protein VIU33_05780 [Nitrospiria bacterium]
MVTCFFCKKTVKIEGKIRRTEACPNCQSDLYVCRNCRFHDSAAHNECRETQAEWVGDKEKANFCDYFEPSVRDEAAEGDKAGAEARKKLDDLFKKP